MTVQPANVSSSCVSATHNSTDSPSSAGRVYIQEAARLALESVEKGRGGPFGAVSFRDGEIIGRGQNRVLLTGVPIYHAEMTAILDACGRIKPKDYFCSDQAASTTLELIAGEVGA